MKAATFRVIWNKRTKRWDVRRWGRILCGWHETKKAAICCGAEMGREIWQKWCEDAELIVHGKEWRVVSFRRRYGRWL